MSRHVAIDYEPYKYQEDIHCSEKRFNIVVGGRRVGKSKMAVMELIKHCIETPKAVAWWVAPTITMAREIGWAEFKEYEEELAPAILSYHETLLRVRFKNFSTLYFKGADNERSLRGRGLTYLVMDEVAFIDEPIWTRVLLPALTDKQGKALLISTPNGRNWFYNATLVAKDPMSMWDYYHWPTEMNPLITQAELAMSKEMVSEMDFRQEFMAEFVTKEGMVYDDFSPDNIISELPDLHNWEICLGIDFGYANPSAVAFLAVNTQTEQVVMFDEIYRNRTPMAELEKLIVMTLAKHNIPPNGVKVIYTDPAGNAEELSSGISPVDFLRQGYYDWNVENKGSEIAPGLALVRAFIKDASGRISFFIHDSCKDAIRSLYGYTYERRTAKTETIKEEASKDGLHDHMADAIRYFFVNRFDQNKWLARQPTQYAYGVDRSTKRITWKLCPGCYKQFSSLTGKTEPPFYCERCANALV